MISFKPVESMLVRVNTSKEDSDVAYFYDLILYGELVTKVVALYMVSNVCDDIDRNCYRYEYKIVRCILKILVVSLQSIYICRLGLGIVLQ